jgi:hypothetical protein
MPTLDPLAPARCGLEHLLGRQNHNVPVDAFDMAASKAQF